MIILWRLKESLALARQVGDPFLLSDCLWSIGDIGHDYGLSDSEQLEALQESLRLARQVSYIFRIGDCFQTMSEFFESKGDLEGAIAHIEEALILRRKLGDKVGIRVSLGRLAHYALLKGDYLKADNLLTEYDEVSRGENLPFMERFITFLRENLERARGEYRKAAELGSKALDLTVELGNKYLDQKAAKEAIVHAICDLGLTAWADGDYELAARNGSEALRLAQENGINQGSAHHLMGKVTLSRGDLAQANLHLKQLLSENSNVIVWIYWNQIINPLEIAVRLRLVGQLASSKEQFAQTATLFGAIYDWEARIPGYYCPKERNDYEIALAKARAALGESAFSAALQEGQSLRLEQAVALAFEVCNA